MKHQIRKTLFALAAAAVCALLLSACTAPTSDPAKTDCTITRSKNCQRDSEYAEACRIIDAIQSDQIDPETMQVIDYTYDICVDMGNQISLYRDGDFMYLFFNPDFGMQQIDVGTAYTLDGGKSWTVGHFHTASGSLYLIDRKLLQVYGVYLYDIPSILISNDYGETYEEMELPVLEQMYRCPALPPYADCLVPKVTADSSDHTVTLQWYTGSSDLPFDSMTFDLADPSQVEDTDPYGFAAYAADFEKTQCVFPDSSTEALDPEELRTRCSDFHRILGCDSEPIVSYLRYAINEIYARKGYDFSGTDFEKDFSQLSWYHPTAGKTAFTEEELTPIEKQNIDLLVALKDKYAQLGSLSEELSLQ